MLQSFNDNILFIFWLFNINFNLNIDSLSLFFIILTTFLIPLCVLSSWNQFIFCYKEFLILLFFIEMILIGFFVTRDFLHFYIFFESILIPLFLVIGSFGSRQRRIHASFQLFFYTLIGSFFMFVNVIYFFFFVGSTNFDSCLSVLFTYEVELLLWFFFFISFAVKVPIYPVHLWLPEAHVEAPTVGSVILAGVLLKMGTYGFLRFFLPYFSFATWYFLPLIQLLAFLSVIYISIITICQIDLKKLIAYSSVAHMGYSIIGLFVLNIIGISSSIFLMLNHGLVSSLLFFIIGLVYDRFKTRIFFYLKALQKMLPILCILTFLAMVANIGFPGTSSFVAEFFIMQSLILFNKLLAFSKGIGLIYSAFYSFWIFNRIFYGVSNKFFVSYSDLNLKEFNYITCLLFFIFFFGLSPCLIVLDLLKTDLYFLFFNIC